YHSDIIVFKLEMSQKLQDNISSLKLLDKETNERFNTHNSSLLVLQIQLRDILQAQPFGTTVHRTDSTNSTSDQPRSPTFDSNLEKVVKEFNYDKKKVDDIFNSLNR